MSKWKEVRRHTIGEYVFDVLWEVEFRPQTMEEPAEKDAGMDRVLAVYKDGDFMENPPESVYDILYNNVNYDTGKDITPEGYNDPEGD